MEISIKPEFKKTKVAFGKGAKPLGELNPDELTHLALIARESNSKKLSEYFDKLPALSDLKKAKTDKAIDAINAANVVSTTPVTDKKN